MKKLRQKILHLANMVSSCRKPLMNEPTSVMFDGLKQRKNILSRRVKSNVARSLVLLICPIMRTYRLRYRSHGYGRLSVIFLSLSYMVLVNPQRLMVNIDCYVSQTFKITTYYGTLFHTPILIQIRQPPICFKMVIFYLQGLEQL